MRLLLLEVSCNLDPKSDLWNEFLHLQLEIGYPALGGKTLWKQIGWEKSDLRSTGKHFIHLLWNAKTADQIIETDFLPVKNSKTNEIERSYKIKRSIHYKDERPKNSVSRTLYENYQDDFFSIVWK
jgi:hypothetical protein